MEFLSRWELYVGTAVAIAALVLGSRFQRGQSRRGMQWYWGNGPWYVRNLPFTFLWTGILLSLWMLGVLLIALADYGSPVPLRVTAVALIALGGASGAVGIAVAFRPPDWAKPEWLREEEGRRGRKGADRPASRAERVAEVFTFVIVFTVATTVAVVPILLMVDLWGKLSSP